jgi:hypothetical protein
MPSSLATGTGALAHRIETFLLARINPPSHAANPRRATEDDYLQLLGNSF